MVTIKTVSSTYPSVEVHMDIDGSPIGTATITLRTGGASFLTARFPFKPDPSRKEDAKSQATDAARKWLTDAVLLI